MKHATGWIVMAAIAALPLLPLVFGTIYRMSHPDRSLGHSDNPNARPDVRHERHAGAGR